MLVFLQKVMASKGNHAKWLNTLSFLEYIGARKIIKSLHSDRIDYEKLRHFSEESRHALFFKKILNNHFSGMCINFRLNNLLGKSTVEYYFQSIDKLVSSSIKGGHSDLYYYYVTLIVEERALYVYNIYNNLLKEQGFQFKLDSLLFEEEKHLEETQEFLIENDKLFLQKIKLLRKEETKLYDNLISQMSIDLNCKLDITERGPSI